MGLENCLFHECRYALFELYHSHIRHTDRHIEKMMNKNSFLVIPLFRRILRKNIYVPIKKKTSISLSIFSFITDSLWRTSVTHYNASARGFRIFNFQFYVNVYYSDTFSISINQIRMCTLSNHEKAKLPNKYIPLKVIINKKAANHFYFCIPPVTVIKHV